MINIRDSAPITVKTKGRALSMGSSIGGKGGKRGVVKCFSEQSAHRLLSVLNSCGVEFKAFITLTLPHIEYDGKVFKDRINAFMQRLDGKALWFLEFQERGSPHLHIYYDSFVPFDWVSEVWSNLWLPRLSDLFGWAVAHDAYLKMKDASCQVIGIKGFKHVVGYATKIFSYASKGKQKEIPNDYAGCGRFWGCRNFDRSVAADIKSRMVFTDEKAIHLKEIVRIMIKHAAKVACQGNCIAYDWKYGLGVMIIFTGDNFKAEILAIKVAIHEDINDYCLKNSLKRERIEKGVWLCQ